MERYDGKTKRDDYIKYGCIAVGIFLILGVLIWFTGFMKQRRQIQYDYSVVIASEEAFNAEMIEDLQSVIGNIVGDQNGDDKVNISVEVLRLTDVTSAKQADREADEAYGDAMMAGGKAPSTRQSFLVYPGMKISPVCCY